MPHAALWVVQLINGKVHGGKVFVSMPHAALWVVQRCRRFLPEVVGRCFNAARGFVGGAASSLSALFPLGGKSTFGKSPEIREF